MIISLFFSSRELSATSFLWTRYPSSPKRPRVSGILDRALCWRCVRAVEITTSIPQNVVWPDFTYLSISSYEIPTKQVWEHLSHNCKLAFFTASDLLLPSVRLLCPNQIKLMWSINPLSPIFTGLACAFQPYSLAFTTTCTYFILFFLT